MHPLTFCHFVVYIEYIDVFLYMTVWLKVSI